MLSAWGGNSGIDTISQDELDYVGYDICEKYCKEYCWHHGIGLCDDCAYNKEYTKRRDVESEGKNENE